ncbi:unnamed protein product [Arctogadus glacialis]
MNNCVKLAMLEVEPLLLHPHCPGPLPSVPLASIATAGPGAVQRKAAAPAQRRQSESESEPEKCPGGMQVLEGRQVAADHLFKPPVRPRLPAQKGWPICVFYRTSSGCQAGYEMKGR